MRLYLIRHGIAIDRDDPDCPSEAERYLTREGISKTKEAMAGLRALGVEVDAMLTSPLVRAAQSARIAAEEWKFDPEKIRTTDALLPSSDAKQILGEVAKLRADGIACFGHAPHLDETIALLAGAKGPFTALKKSGAAWFEVFEPRAGGGMLVALYPAGALRRVT